MFSFFGIKYPSLTYAIRLSAPVTDSDLLNPDKKGANSSISVGEWLAYDGLHVSKNTTSAVVFPALNGARRLDSQSAQNISLLVGPKGSIVTTDGYNTSLSYNVGDDLIVASFWVDDDGTVKYGLVPDNTSTTGTPSSAGDIVAVGSTVVARVVRAPYTPSGLGINPESNVIDIQLI